MIKSIIAAMGKNRVIGKNNELLWRLPSELGYFKKTTMGHHMIVGRKTFQSYPKPLPGRTSIIITKDQSFIAPPACIVCHTLQEAFDLAKNQNETEIFITGGAQIYAQTINLCDRLYLTTVDFEQDGDAYFPEFDTNKWVLESESFHDADEKNKYSWVARVYNKK